MSRVAVVARDAKVVTAHVVDGRIVPRTFTPAEARELAARLIEAARIADMQPMAPGDVVALVTGARR